MIVVLSSGLIVLCLMYCGEGSNERNLVEVITAYESISWFQAF